MACRKPIDKNRRVKGKREGEFRLGAVVCSLKEDLSCCCSPKTGAQYPSSSRSRRQTCVCIRLCVGTPFCPFIPTALLCVHKVCKGSIKRRREKKPVLVTSSTTSFVLTPGVVSSCFLGLYSTKSIV